MRRLFLSLALCAGILCGCGPADDPTQTVYENAAFGYSFDRPAGVELRCLSRASVSECPRLAVSKDQKDILAIAAIDPKTDECSGSNFPKPSLSLKRYAGSLLKENQDNNSVSELMESRIAGGIGYSFIIEGYFHGACGSLLSDRSKFLVATTEFSAKKYVSQWLMHSEDASNIINTLRFAH